MFETESFAAEINSERKLVFYRNRSDTSTRSSANERLFILPGTLIHHLDDAYMWIEDNELYYVNVKQFKLNVPVRKSDTISVEPFYLVYSGDAACHKWHVQWKMSIIFN